jgi:PncC family amidohydrolase
MGLVTYSNQAKISVLKVPKKIIQKHGAVSIQCCLSMVHNLSKISKSKICISITGIAGPKGGTKQKPVGLVYIGLKQGKKIIVSKNKFKNKGRSSIQKATVKKALHLILKQIKL